MKCINEAYETLQDGDKRRDYDRRLQAQRDAAAERDRKQKAESQAKRRKIDVDSISKVFTVYRGDFFHPTFMAKASVENWIKNGKIRSVGTFLASTAVVASRGLMLHSAEVLGMPDLKIDALRGETERIVFVSAAKGVLFTAQSLQQLDVHAIPVFECRLLEYLRSNQTKTSVSIVVFDRQGEECDIKSDEWSGGASGASSSAGPGATTIQIVFGAILHCGKYYIDNRATNPTNSASHYLPPVTHPFSLTIGDLSKIISQLAVKFQKTFSVFEHVVMRVTGDVENLSQTSTPHNYRPCLSLSGDQTALEVGVSHTFAVIARSTTDSGTGRATGSRAFYFNSQQETQSRRIEDIVQGLQFKILVPWRVNKSHPCAVSFKPVDNSPHILASTLRKFLHQVAATLPAATITSEELEAALLRWPAENLPSNFVRAGASRSGPSMPSRDQPSITTTGSLLRQLSVESELPGHSDDIVTVVDVTEPLTEHSITTDVFVRCSADLYGTGKMVNGGKCRVRLSTAVGELQADRWIDFERVSRDTKYFIVKVGGSAEVKKIAIDKFTAKPTNSTLTPEEEYCGAAEETKSPDSVYH